MMDRKEISELKRTHDGLEKKMEEVDNKQYSRVVELSEQLNELIENMESTREREESLWNPDISTKIKVVKKGARLYKRLQYFEVAVAKEFENGNISQETGKRFMSVTTLIKDNKMPLAKKEFEHFLEIIALSKKYQASKEELEKTDKVLRKEQHRIENLLAEISSLEKQTINMEKAERYRQLLDNLQKLEKIRAEYLLSLTSKPVSALLKDADKLREHLPGFPGKGKTDELQAFFSAYPELGGYTAGQICETFNFSDKKLSHVCPETVRFKKTILGSKKLFETLHGLERTSFLAVDDGNEKSLDFFAEKVEGAKDTVEQIRLLRKGKLSCREEYEKKKKYEERKKELSKYSKDSLEKELEEVKSLLELLHSAPEEKEESKGLLSAISSFFRTGEHN